MKRFLACAPLTIALLAAAAWPSSATAKALEGWHTDLDDAVAEAKEHDRYLLVDLYAEWCGWCKVLEEEVFSSPGFRAYAKDLVLLYVDTEDGAQGTALQARYGINSLPTTLLLSPDLVKVGTVTGFAPTDRFIATVKQQIEGWEAMVAFHDKVLRSSDPELQRDLAEDFHDRGDGERAAALYQRVIEQVEPGTAALGWLQYQLADARRLHRDFDAAERALDQSRTTAAEVVDAELVERLDLLAYYLAKDRGDCDGAVASLQTFLTAHPKSRMTFQARRALQAIKSGEGMVCT